MFFKNKPSYALWPGNRCRDTECGSMWAVKYFLTGILPDMLKESGYASKYSRNVCMKRNKKRFVVFQREMGWMWGVGSPACRPVWIKCRCVETTKLEQNVSRTQQRDCSNHLSAATTAALRAGLPHPTAIGKSPPHTLSARTPPAWRGKQPFYKET